MLDERLPLRVRRRIGYRYQTQCWPWLGALFVRGYGQLRDNDTQRVGHASRYVYQRLVSAIPDGLELDHLCRQHDCVNPSHLDPVPHRINVLRGESPSAQNARKVACKHGHPFSPENTRIVAASRRVCKQCRRVANRAYKQRRRAAERGGFCA